MSAKTLFSWISGETVMDCKKGGGGGILYSVLVCVCVCVSMHICHIKNCNLFEILCDLM